MTEESKPINGAPIEEQVQDSIDSRVAKMEAAKVNYLDKITHHTQQSFVLLEMTEDDVAKVAFKLMMDAFLRSFPDTATAMGEMEKMVVGTVRAMGHDKAVGLILPPGVGRH